VHNLLTTSTDLLRVITGSAADLDCVVSYLEYTTAGPPVPDAPDSQFTNITTATTTTILGAPTTGSDRRKIKAVSIVNTHASVSTTVRVIIERTGPVNWDLFNTVTLAPGTSLTFTEGTGWFLNKAVVPTLSSGAATTAQIASHSADTYYLGMPITNQGVTRLQVGSMFRWKFRTNKGGGTATPIYTIRVGTAGTTSDTARITMTGAAQTAVADEGWVEIDVGFRAVGASAVMVANHGLWHRLATTGLSVTASNVFMTPVVSAAFDATPTGSIISLTVNPGTAGAWVTDLVTLDASNLVS
jgi:hypothetical protein